VAGFQGTKPTPALTRPRSKRSEHYYGAKLIQTARGKRQLTLTEAGERLPGQGPPDLPHRRNHPFRYADLHKKASGTLRFSVSPAKSTFFINTYLRPFAAAYPEICFQFREEAVSAQTRHIAENSSDFAFANAPLPSPQLFATLPLPLPYRITVTVTYRRRRTTRSS